MVEAIIFFSSFLISFFLTYPFIFLFKKIGLVTDAKKRKHPAHTHQGLVPRGGGLPILLSVITSIVFFVSLNKIIIGVIIGSIMLVLLGLIDDWYDLSPYWRFFINLLIASIVVGFGLGIPFISNPLGGVIDLSVYKKELSIFGLKEVWYLADLAAIFWLVLVINLVNWSKGVDGQMPGFVSIASFFLSLIALRFSGHDIQALEVSRLGLIVCGAFAGFTYWNFYPQRIMPGYGGGALAGFYLGVLSILAFGKLGTAIMVLAVPLIDGIYTILRRIINKKSPFLADWGHFHHRLLEIGWGRRRIALFYWIVSFYLGLVSLFFSGWQKLTAFFGVSLLLIIFIFIIESIKDLS